MENYKTTNLCQPIRREFLQVVELLGFRENDAKKGIRLVVGIVPTRTGLLEQTNKMWMNTNKIFNNDLAAITFKPRIIDWIKTAKVGAIILKLSKRHIYGFHYKQRTQISNPSCSLPTRILCFTRLSRKICTKTSKTKTQFTKR